MLDLKFIRENPELVREALVNRQDSSPLDEILGLDQERRPAWLRNGAERAGRPLQESGDASDVPR